jgi:hypothetical protein
MSAPFMEVPTQSRTSLRFAKAISSSPRTCPWFGLTSVVLKRSSSVSALCAFPYLLFPGRFSARLRRCTASSRPWPVAPKTLPFLTPTGLVVCMQTLTHSSFVGRFKTELSHIGMDSSRYAGHSFRRGGATFAFQCGASPAQFKEQGDWKSSAYLLNLLRIRRPGPWSGCFV